MDMKNLAKEIIEGRRLTKEEDLSFFETCDLSALMEGADWIREHFCGDKVDLCTIINGKSGKCPEDCKYCAQSAHHHTCVENYDFLPIEEIVKENSVDNMKYFLFDRIKCVTLYNFYINSNM